MRSNEFAFGLQTKMPFFLILHPTCIQQMFKLVLNMQSNPFFYCFTKNFILKNFVLFEGEK